MRSASSSSADPVQVVSTWITALIAQGGDELVHDDVGIL